MLSPGSKGWINKYFDLVENGKISLKKQRPDGMRKDDFLHLTFGKSGIIFGFPVELIFAQKLNDENWTQEEKLKLLLFESHLLIYKKKHKGEAINKQNFVHSLVEFYRFHNGRVMSKIFNLFKKETEVEMLENILAKRVEIKISILENKWWVNSLSNAFTYLDVLLYNDFKNNRNSDAFTNYSSFAQNALTAITLSAYSDGVIEDREKSMFNLFLASASLDEEQREIAKKQFKKGADFSDLSADIEGHWLLKRFLLSVATLTIFSNHEIIDDEVKFLKDLAKKLSISEIEMEETFGMIENFLLKSRESAVFLSDNSTYEKVFSSYSKRWSKVLMRNKDKLAVELKQSGQLILLVKKSATQELSKEEKKMVKEQFKDIVKSVPALAIFMLPGGAVLLPLILKIIPDLVPSAFKENQLDQDENQD
jgi:hypothetical protein